MPFRLRTPAVILTALVSLSACAVPTPVGMPTGAITSVGSSTQAWPVHVWTSSWMASNNRVSVNNSPDGEQVAFDALSNGQAQVVFTERPLTPAAARAVAACGPQGAFSIPTIVLPLVVGINASELDNITLDATVLREIFAGHINQWDDSRIQKLNPELKLPHRTITPITTSQASSYNARALQYLGIPQRDTWPKDQTGISVRHLADISPELDKTAGGIAFVERAAQFGRFGNVSLITPSGPIAAVDATIQNAAANGSYTADAQGSIIYSPPTDSPSAYPLTVTGYMSMCHVYKDRATADLVAAWARYITTEGQRQNVSTLRAGAIPPTAQEMVSAAISNIGVPN